MERLAFGELEPFTGSLLPVLFALMGARVAGEHSQLLQLAAELDIEITERAGDTQADGAGLTGVAAAFGGDVDVKLVGRFGGEQGLAHHGLGGLGGKILFEGAAVDFDITAAWTQEDASDGSFPAACSEILN